MLLRGARPPSDRGGHDGLGRHTCRRRVIRDLNRSHAQPIAIVQAPLTCERLLTYQGAVLAAQVFDERVLLVGDDSRVTTGDARDIEADSRCRVAANKILSNPQWNSPGSGENPAADSG